MVGLQGEFGPVEPRVEVRDDSRWWEERPGSLPKPSSLAHQGRPLCISSESWPGGRSGIRSIDESIFLGTANEVGFEGDAWEPCPTAGVTGYRPAREKEPGDEVRWPCSSAAWLLGVNRLGEWLFACNMAKL